MKRYKLSKWNSWSLWEQWVLATTAAEVVGFGIVGVVSVAISLVHIRWFSICRNPGMIAAVMQK